MRKFALIIIVAVIPIMQTFSWTESIFGTCYDSVASLEKREKMLDNMQQMSKKGISRKCLANIFDLTVMLSSEHQNNLVMMLALMATESDFYYKADSCLGAKYGRGIMQVSERALQDYNKWNGTKYKPNDLYNLEINLRVGFWVFNHNRKYGIPKNDLKKSLSAYNLGAGNVRRGKIAHNYVAKVTAKAQKIWA